MSPHGCDRERKYYKNTSPSNQLAWQSAFRTYDWAKALGDADLTIRQTEQLMNLA